MTGHYDYDPSADSTCHRDEQWITSKYESDLKKIRESVEKLYEENKNEDLPFFTPHGVEHCRAVENLIKNGVEAQSGGGFMKIECVGKDAYCEWSVENGGFDLEPDAVEKIFEPYFTGKTRGTGLGLAMVQRIVAAHKGYVRARADGHGVFKITVGLPFESDRNRRIYENTDNRR